MEFDHQQDAHDQGGEPSGSRVEPDAWLLEVTGPRPGSVMRARLPLSAFASPEIELIPADAAVEEGVGHPPKPDSVPPEAPAADDSAPERRRNVLIGLTSVLALGGLLLIAGIAVVRAILPEGDQPAAPATAELEGMVLPGLVEGCRVKFDRAVITGLPIGRLGREGVLTRPVSPASSTAQLSFVMPVLTSNSVRCDQLSGVIGLVGGLRFERAGQSADLRRLRIDGSSGVLRRRAPGDQIRGRGLMRLEVDQGRWVAGADLVSYRAPLRLTPGGAAELNRSLRAGLFRPGDVFGAMTLSGRVQTVSVGG